MKERKKDEEREEEEGEKKEGRPEEKERSPTGAAMNNWSRASERKRHAGKGAPRAWPLLTGGWRRLARYVWGLWYGGTGRLRLVGGRSGCGGDGKRTEPQLRPVLIGRLFKGLPG